MAVIAFPTSFGHDSKVLVERTSLFLVIEQVEIDRFMAHGEAKVGFHDIGNLLGAVIVLNQV